MSHFLRRQLKVRFTLSMLFLMVTVSCALAAIVAYHSKAARRKSQVVTNLRSWGGEVVLAKPASFAGSDVMRYIYGHEYTDGVSSVTISGFAAQPLRADYPYPDFPAHKASGERRSLVERRVINRRYGVQDRHLLQLLEFPSLQQLGLAETGVTDSGLHRLSHLEHLESLDLSDTLVTGAGLTEFRSLDRLKTLRMPRTKLTDSVAGQVFPKLNAIETLDIAHTAVSDKSLEALSGATRISVLNISRTQISSASVPVLLSFKNLTILDVRRTCLTDTDIQALRSSHPNCWISWVRPGSE